MNIGDVLAVKGSDVITIKPNETIGCLSRQLQQARVGVMVVSQDGASMPTALRSAEASSTYCKFQL